MIEEIWIIVLRTLTFFWSDLVEVVGEDRSEAAIVQRPDVKRAGRDALGPASLDAAIEPQDAEAGAKALLGMRPVGEHGGDEPFGARPDAPAPAAEALGRPF